MIRTMMCSVVATIAVAAPVALAVGRIGVEAGRAQQAACTRECEGWGYAAGYAYDGGGCDCAGALAEDQCSDHAADDRTRMARALGEP